MSLFKFKVLIGFVAASICDVKLQHQREETLGFHPCYSEVREH